MYEDSHLKHPIYILYADRTEIILINVIYQLYNFFPMNIQK